MIIGYAYVVGDIIHRGHLLHLRNCRALCDALVVGVLTDEAVMEKKKAPVLSFDERVEIVGSVVYVDAVVAQATYSPRSNVLNIKPDVLFESESHAETDCPGFDGRIVVMPYYPLQSSTAIKEAIRERE